MSTRGIIARFLAWAAVFNFALLLGAHMFDTFVLLPVWTASPPESLSAWLSTPQYADVPRYMRPLVIATLVIPPAAFIAGFADGPPRRWWLAIAAGCAVAHVTLVLIFFVPTNQILGFLPSAERSIQVAPETAQALVRQWVNWNWVRIALDTVGLYSAVRATASNPVEA